MLALHATWTVDDQLALWAEAPIAALPPPRRGRATNRPSPHPFAAPPEALRALIDAVRPGLDWTEADLTLALPSSSRGPSPSPQAWIDEPPPPPTELRRWNVPTVVLAGGEAFDLMLAIGEGEATGAVLGDTVRYFVQIARFAVALCARGRVIPGIAYVDNLWEARWKPCLTDLRDLHDLDVLQRGLPGALRQQAKVVDRALAAFVDACAASILAGVQLKATRGRRNWRHDGREWLIALTADDPVLPDLQLGESPYDDLAEKLAAWEASGAPPAEAFRACFQVSAPEDGDAWRLDVLLQAVDDPSLRIPAAEVWATRGRVLRRDGRALVDPQEHLLKALGRAAAIAPVVQRALSSARPTGVDLDARDAWSFLREAAPLLTAAGIAVLAPPWWTRPTARLGARLRATPREGVGKLGLDALCDVHWEVALGDDVLSAAEIARLARLKAPLVQLRGQWVELRPEDVAAALAFYDKSKDRVQSARDVLRAGLGLDPHASTLPIVGIHGSGWLGDLLADAGDARYAPVDAPPGFGTALRPYQARGLGWLLFLDRLGLGACLADDMGLGKTVQLLAMLVHERRDGPVHGPTLLVCPMSLIGNWQREAARFAPKLRVHVHHGADRARKGAFAKAVSKADLVLTTYATLTRDAERLAEVQWGRAVLDEAQNIKNASTRQAKAAFAVQAPKRVALTGTPVENRLSELWSILEFLNPGLLGSANGFQTRFAVAIERHGDADAAARLRRVTSPFILRRVKTDKSIVSDLPDKFEVKVPCHLTREQATLYQAVVDEMLGRLDGLEGDKRRGAVLAAMTKLKQVCDHPALLLQDRSVLPGRSGKLARLEEILDEVVANGEKALVFTQFTEMGHPLKAHLQERLSREVLYLHGGTPRAARDAMVQRFSTEDGPPVFLLSLKAGGTGLNLVAANHVVHFDRWWNPAVEDQATDRAYRIGQTKGVQVRKLVCGGTLEERIDEMIEGKRALAGQVVGSGEGWLSDLSTRALAELVALDPDAVGEE